MSYKAVNIARYVINRANDQGGHISNLKLQKILYYIQAAFLVETGNPCYEDEIVRWRHGPVIKSVYDNFRCYADRDIPRQEEVLRFVVEDGQMKFEKKSFSYEWYEEKDRKLLNRVIDGLEGYAPWYLVDRTHEETPWAELSEYNIVITNTSIKNYFMQTQNRGRMYGEYN